MVKPETRDNRDNLKSKILTTMTLDPKYYNDLPDLFYRSTVFYPVIYVY